MYVWGESVLSRGNNNQCKGPEHAGMFREQPGSHGGWSRASEGESQGRWSQGWGRGFGCALSGMRAQRPPCHSHTESQAQ